MNTNKKIIKVAIAPGSSFSSGLDLDSLINFLSLKTNFDFKTIRCKSYKEAISKLTTGQAQMGWLGPFSSNEATKKGLIEPFAVGLPKDQDSPNYHSLFVVKTESKIYNLNDIRRKKIIVCNKYSTSGYIIPKIELNEIGINIDNNSEFSEIFRTKNHDETIKKLLNNIGDVATVSSINLYKYIKDNKLDKNKIRIIHKSKPIPGAPLVFNSKLSETTKKENQRFGP